MKDRDLEAEMERQKLLAHVQGQIDRMRQVYEFIYAQYGYTFLFGPRTELVWWSYGVKDQLESYLKWKTAWLVARTLSQLELPPKASEFEKDVTDALTVEEGRFWKTRWNSSRVSRRFIDFAFALYQAKSGSMPARDEVVFAAVNSAVERLTAEPAAEERRFIGCQWVTKDDLAFQLERTIREVYPRTPPSERPLPPAPREEYAASIRSSYEFTRAEGGPAEFLVKEVSPLGFDHLVGYACLRGRVQEIRSPFDPLVWEECLERSRRRAWATDTVGCYPVGLVEPFKVRVITRGQVDSYHLARRYQGRLWRPLTEHPAFRLVGRPLDDQIVRSFLSRCSDRKGLEFLSGDYKAATDFFHNDLSEFAVTTLLERIGACPEDIPAVRNALTRHRIESASTKRPHTTGLQTRGQLMGSPVSFPILCLYNAAFSRYAMEIASGESLRLDDMPILVNGDDLLMQSDHWGFQVWKDLTSFGGLMCSVGKTYMSDRVFTLNSELWHTSLKSLSPAHGNPFWGRSPTKYWSAERHDFPLMGLVHGSIKSGGGTSTNNGWRNTELPWEVKESPDQGFSGRQSMGARWERFLSSCPQKALAWTHMWENNQDYVRSLPVGTALCLPAWLGGGNVPLPPRDHPYYRSRIPSSRQLVTAAYLQATFMTSVGKEWARALKGTGLPLYLQSAMDEDRRLRDTLGCREVVDDTDSDPVPDWQKPPLLPFSMTGFLPMGCLRSEDLKVPGKKSPEDKEEEKESYKRERRLRLSIWNRIRSRALRSKRAPLCLDTIPWRPPSTTTEAYAVV